MPQVNVNEGEKKGNVERWLLEVQETTGCTSKCGSLSSVVLELETATALEVQMAQAD